MSAPSEAKYGAHLGWLLLAPVAALAWPGPGAALSGDPYPHLAATGVALLFALPAALLLIRIDGRLPRGFGLFVTLWALIALAVGFGAHSDAFEARRSLAHFTLLAVAFLGGALASGPAREIFVRGLVLLSVTFTAGALGLHALDGHYAGVLGDTGSLSQAALPGGIIGVWFFALRRGLWRILGLAAFLGIVAHTSLAPVLGAGGSLVIVLMTTSLMSPISTDRPRFRRRLGMCAAAAFFALIALRGLPSTPEAPAPTRDDIPAAVAEDTDFGGVAVRLAVWKRIPALLLSSPVLGAGPGQFQAAFPPFRDPREIERSRHGVCSELSTEVEHAHQDLLEGLAEFGLVGGALWLGLLLFALVASLGSLRRKDVVLGAAGAAGLGMLVNALYHAPLLFNAAAAVPAFALFGMLLARPEAPGAPGASRRFRVQVALCVVLAVLAFGWPSLQHGRALARGDLLGALAAVPDSAPARLLGARVRPTGRASWVGALELRPHSVEALEGLGVQRARQARMPEATSALERALGLSPTHPRILRNAVRVAFIQGDTGRGSELLARLQASGCLGADWPAELGATLVLDGDLTGGVHLLFGRPLEELVPEELNDQAQDLEEADPDRARALRALAQLLWARSHVAREDYPTAVRSYRQSWNATRAGGGGAASIRLEMAGAELRAGRTPDAASLPGSRETGFAWPNLPGWAREALQEAGIGPRG